MFRVLPLHLLKWLRTLATVRLLLSVAVSTKTAMPCGAYPSKLTSL